MSDSDLTEQEKRLFDKLMAVVDRHAQGKRKDDPYPFDDDEIQTIRRMMRLYAAFTSLGLFANATRNVVIYLALILGAYYSTKTWFAEAVKDVIGK